MNIFISWSGGRSKAVAEFLRDWIRCVLQATRPWVSTRDLDRGSVWFSEINERLKDTAVGIVCLTHENKDRPWILFEAGALTKGLTSNRICTFLIDLRPIDIKDPLAQFNHTLPDRDSVLGMIETINNQLGTASLEQKSLLNVFDTYWDQFESKFSDILNQTDRPVDVAPRQPDDILAEILDNTRHLTSRIRILEEKQSTNCADPSRLKLDSDEIRNMIRSHAFNGLTMEQAIEQISLSMGSKQDRNRLIIMISRHWPTNSEIAHETLRNL
ncbi:MAG: toll/interleukin-1 receptor domain-containing protein [Pirellulaceae bacterium]|nr:toll/interleukin-1 receptor domain-containing protein [Pirellulaceae bacterium]